MQLQLQETSEYRCMACSCFKPLQVCSGCMDAAGDDAAGLSGPAGTAGCRDRQAGSRKTGHEGAAAANAGEQSLLRRPTVGEMECWPACMYCFHSSKLATWDYARCTGGHYRCAGLRRLLLCLQERLELQRQAEAEFNAERALVDEVVARIQQEDRMELAARRAKQADTKVSKQLGHSSRRRQVAAGTLYGAQLA